MAAKEWKAKLGAMHLRVAGMSAGPFVVWKAASLPRMRCIVPARLRRRCASAATTRTL